jgi:hypothetical protein
METGIYKNARKAYDEALKNVRSKFYDKKRMLNKKIALARAMESAQALNLPFLRDIFLLRAKTLNDSEEELHLVSPKDFKALKTDTYLFGIILGVFLGILFLGRFLFGTNRNERAIAGVSKYSVARAWDLYDAALNAGDHYMQRYKIYGNLRVHVLDSAVMAYKRAMMYNPLGRSAVVKYNRAKRLWSSYLNLVQRLIRKYPKKYFVAMRPYSEGLRFFKFLFRPGDKSVGKYGYVDRHMNVVIPPIFDFDYYHRIKPGWEDFHNGKAVACLVINVGDTAYFQINREGKIASAVYRYRWRFVRRRK